MPREDSGIGTRFRCVYWFVPRCAACYCEVLRCVRSSRLVVGGSAFGRAELRGCLPPPPTYRLTYVAGLHRSQSRHPAANAAPIKANKYAMPSHCTARAPRGPAANGASWLCQRLLDPTNQQAPPAVGLWQSKLTCHSGASALSWPICCYTPHARDNMCSSSRWRMLASGSAIPDGLRKS